jgi:hypothetical protein
MIQNGIWKIFFFFFILIESHWKRDIPKYHLRYACNIGTKKLIDLKKVQGSI